MCKRDTQNRGHIHSDIVVLAPRELLQSVPEAIGAEDLVLMRRDDG